jgi:hypothetical protein
MYAFDPRVAKTDSDSLPARARHACQFSEFRVREELCHQSGL